MMKEEEKEKKSVTRWKLIPGIIAASFRASVIVIVVVAVLAVVVVVVVVVVGVSGRVEIFSRCISTVEDGWALVWYLAVQTPAKNNVVTT